MEKINKAAEKYADNKSEKMFFDSGDGFSYDELKESFLDGVKWKEKQIIKLIQFLSTNKEFKNYSSVSKETANYFYEQFKNKI